MISTLPDRIIALAAPPNAQFELSEPDQWLAAALANRGSVLGEMLQSIVLVEQSPTQAPTPPSKWQAVKLDASKPKKRRVIIKRRK
ncbi:MAG: hypothetical protein AAFN10_09160 [Bacteroidota bacterium]